MNNCSKCYFPSTCLGIFAGLVFGVATGLLFYFGYLASIITGIWVVFGIAAATLLFILVTLVVSGKDSIPTLLSYCVCQNAVNLLVSSIGSILFAIIALMAIPSGIFFTVILAITAFFFGYLLSSILGFAYCIACRECPHRQ